MANQDRIKIHIEQNPDCLGKLFGYRAVYKIANDIIDATVSGKSYATMKFLQKYCTPINVIHSNVSKFRDGDPRQYIELYGVKNSWEFAMTENDVVDDSVSIKEKEDNPVIIVDPREEPSMELLNYPVYYRQYSWNGKHKLFGYPTDSYPGFLWINSLEKRFIWLRENSAQENTASKYLIQEMIEWGGSQNGVLQKFNDGSGEVNLFQLVQEIIAKLDNPREAISSSLALPGLGLTYASKLLRFMKPEKYGALDSRIRRELLNKNLLPKITDGNIKSMVNGYVKFLNLLDDLKNQLEEQGVRKPDCSLSNSGLWKPSEIEMALFRWVEVQ